MDDNKLEAKLLKIKALAERGEGGEKEAAIKMYHKLLKKYDIDEKALQKWRDKYRYVLIDEFQDINKIQYEIVKMLSGENQNLFIVGDDDQSIYKFRGARPELMLNFPKDFKNTKQVILNRNYRCGKQIVQTAEDIISYNTKRFEKKMEAR